MSQLPSIQDLQAFEAAARQSSFTHAAEELHVTAGAVSRRLQHLEELLGVRLFRREHRRVVLTAVGREYLASVSEALLGLEKASRKLASRPGGDAVSVYAYPTFAFRWLIPRWARFYDAHPALGVQLTTSLNPVDLTRDPYDLVIEVSDRLGASGAVTREKLLDVELYPVCSPSLGRELTRLEDLRGQTLLHGDPRPEDWRRWLDAAGWCSGDQGIDPDSGLRFESSNLAFQAAVEGLGVAIGLEVLIQEDLAQGRLVKALDPVRRSRRPFMVAYRTPRRDDPPLACFREWLLEEAAASRRALAEGRRALGPAAY